jgi:hypothetical protein
MSYTLNISLKMSLFLQNQAMSASHPFWCSKDWDHGSVELPHIVSILLQLYAEIVMKM